MFPRSAGRGYTCGPSGHSSLLVGKPFVLGGRTGRILLERRRWQSILPYKSQKTGAEEFHKDPFFTLFPSLLTDVSGTTLSHLQSL